MKQPPPAAADARYIEAMEANVVYFFRLIQSWPRVTLYESEAYLQGVSDHPFALFNPVIRARMTPDNVDAGVAAAVARCRAQGVSLMWWRLPSDTPANLGEVMERHGLNWSYTDPGMVLELDQYEALADVPPPFSMRLVSGGEMLQQFTSLLMGAFGFSAAFQPPMLSLMDSLVTSAGDALANYIGYWQGKAVACGTLLFTGDTAGIYNVGTLAAARRRGIGQALCDGLAQAAIQRGSQIACLQSSQDGLPLYRRMGFRTVCQVPIHFWEAPGSGIDVTGE